MSEERKMSPVAVVTISLVAFILVLALFYGLNHFVMGLQGLPLNLDMTPAQ
jgi:hypothetical protein